MDTYSRKPHEDSVKEVQLTWKSYQLVNRMDFNECDRDDLEQEIHLRFIEKEHYYDKRLCSPKSWASMIADQAAATIIRDRHAQKRWSGSTTSLNNTIDKNKEEEKWEGISTAEVDEAAGRRRRTDAEQAALKQDLDVVLRRLTPRDREICRALMKGSISEVASDMNVPRTTLHSWISRMRPLFVCAGMDEYLEPEVVKLPLNRVFNGRGPALESPTSWN